MSLMVTQDESDYIVRFYFKHREHLIENGACRAPRFVSQRNVLFKQLLFEINSLFGTNLTRTQVKGHWDNRRSKAVRRAKELKNDTNEENIDDHSNEVDQQLLELVQSSSVHIDPKIDQNAEIPDQISAESLLSTLSSDAYSAFENEDSCDRVRLPERKPLKNIQEDAEPFAKKANLCENCDDLIKFKREKWEVKKKFYETLTESLQLMNEQIKKNMEK